MNYNAFERSGIGLSFWLGEPLSPRAPFLRILVSFSGIAVARRLILTTEAYWGLKGMGEQLLVFCGSITFEKSGILEKYNRMNC